MTAIQIARQLNTRLIRNGKGFQCSCPVKLRHEHGDRSRSLSIREVGDWIRFKCFTGCEREEILSALGLTVRDLSLKELTRNPEWEQKHKDSDRLELVTSRWGIAEWLRAIETGKRNYWHAVAQKYFEEMYWLRCKLEPEWLHRRECEVEVQRIIAEYGAEALLDYFWRGRGGVKMRAKLGKRTL